MPTKKVKKDGKTGYKWGNRGPVYTGTGAKAKADRYGRAVEANIHKGKK